MKKFVFILVFTAVITSLFSFKKGNDSVECPPPPPPSSINFFKITDCTGDYRVRISFPLGSGGEVYINGPNNFGDAKVLSANQPYVEFRLPCCSVFNVALGIWCAPLTYSSFVTPYLTPADIPCGPIRCKICD